MAPAYRQALFVITVDPLHMTLTIVDGVGNLRSLDPTQSLIDATSRMVAGSVAGGESVGC